MSAPKKDELVIEINHPKNSDVYFRPIGRALRSRFITQRSGPGHKGPLQAFTLTPIPGLRIHLNLKQRYGRISDPLGDPENKAVLERVNAVNKQLSLPASKPVDDEEFKSMDEVTALSWLYYMMILVEGKRCNVLNPTAEDGLSFEKRPFAEVVQGSFPAEFPDSLALRQTGKIRSFNPNRMRGESLYVHPLPENEYTELRTMEAV